MAKRIMVTGGAGFIGGYLVKLYKSKGYRVLDLDKAYKGKDASDLNHIKVEVDLVSQRELMSIKEYISNLFPEFLKDLTIIHLAADPDLRRSVIEPIPNAKDNVLGTINLLQVFNPKRVIFASSGSVYGNGRATPKNFELNPASPYAASKVAGEAYIRSWCNLNQSSSASICRFFNVTGLGGNDNGVVAIWLKNALKGKPLIVNGNYDIVRDYIYVKDLVRMIYEIQQKDTSKFGIFNLGYGRKITLGELSNIILRVTKSKSEVILGEAIAGDVLESVALGLHPIIKDFINDTECMQLEKGIEEMIKILGAGK